MNKIFIIIQREYLTRVRKKSFVVMTLLVPLLVTGVMLIPVWLPGIKDPEVKDIAVIDQTGKYESAFESNETYRFYFMDESFNSIRETKENYALVVISDDLSANPAGITIYSGNRTGPEFNSYLAGLLNPLVEEEKLEQYDVPRLKEIIKEVKTGIDIQTVNWADSDADRGISAESALIPGLIAAFLIYFFILMYGSQVMRGIAEEKTSRIVEIIISSVKPFELMAGKITGIALVGLTQFLIWIALIFIITAVSGNNPEYMAIREIIFPPDADPNVLSGNAVLSLFSSSRFIIAATLFVIYFLGGYLFYSSLFAAIGAASDSETDTQQFMIPVTIPVIFALFAAIYSTNNPDGPLAFWCSMIPFTSPIVMMVRIPLGVPAWEVILSVFILYASFAGAIRITAKIYRTGILMYGKKITYKEIWKWIK